MGAPLGAPWDPPWGPHGAPGAPMGAHGAQDSQGTLAKGSHYRCMGVHCTSSSKETKHIRV